MSNLKLILRSGAISLAYLLAVVSIESFALNTKLYEDLQIESPFEPNNGLALPTMVHSPGLSRARLINFRHQDAAGVRGAIGSSARSMGHQLPAKLISASVARAMVQPDSSISSNHDNNKGSFIRSKRDSNENSNSPAQKSKSSGKFTLVEEPVLDRGSVLQADLKRQRALQAYLQDFLSDESKAEGGEEGFAVEPTSGDSGAGAGAGAGGGGGQTARNFDPNAESGLANSDQTANAGDSSTGETGANQETKNSEQPSAAEQDGAGNEQAAAGNSEQNSESGPNTNSEVGVNEAPSTGEEAGKQESKNSEQNSEQSGQQTNSEPGANEASGMSDDSGEQEGAKNSVSDSSGSVEVILNPIVNVNSGAVGDSVSQAAGSSESTATKEVEGQTAAAAAARNSETAGDASEPAANVELVATEGSDAPVGGVKQALGNFGSLSAQNSESPVEKEAGGQTGLAARNSLNDPLTKVKGSFESVGAKLASVAGNVKQVAGDVKQVAGDVKQVTGDGVKQVAGDVKQVVEDVKKVIGDGIKKVVGDLAAGKFATNPSEPTGGSSSSSSSSSLKPMAKAAAGAAVNQVTGNSATGLSEQAAAGAGSSLKPVAKSAGNAVNQVARNSAAALSEQTGGGGSSSSQLKPVVNTVGATAVRGAAEQGDDNSDSTVAKEDGEPARNSPADTTSEKIIKGVSGSLEPGAEKQVSGLGEGPEAPKSLGGNAESAVAQDNGLPREEEARSSQPDPLEPVKAASENGPVNALMGQGEKGGAQLASGRTNSQTDPLESVGEVVGDVKQKVKDVKQTVGEVVKQIVEDVEQKVKDVKQAVGEVVKKEVDKVSGIVEETKQVVGDTIEQVAGNLESGVEKLLDPVKGSKAGGKRKSHKGKGGQNKYATTESSYDQYGVPVGDSPFLDGHRSTGPQATVDRLADIANKAAKFSKKKPVVYGSGSGTAFLDPETGFSNVLARESTLFNNHPSEKHSSSTEQLIKAITEAGFPGLEKILGLTSKVTAGKVDKATKLISPILHKVEKVVGDTVETVEAGISGDSKAEFFGSPSSSSSSSEAKYELPVATGISSHSPYEKLLIPYATSNYSPECQHKIKETRSLLSKVIKLSHHLTLRLLGEKRISYSKRGGFVRKLVQITTDAEKAKSAAEFGDIGKLSSGIRNTSHALTRLAGNSHCLKLEPGLRVITGKLRSAYNALRNVCSSSSY